MPKKIGVDAIVLKKMVKAQECTVQLKLIFAQYNARLSSKKIVVKEMDFSMKDKTNFLVKFETVL